MGSLINKEVISFYNTASLMIKKANVSKVLSKLLKKGSLLYNT